MPPAKKKDTKSERGQQKALEREKQKIIEDKTFGLKNKNKSKAVQKFIKSVQQSAKGPQKGGESQEILKKKQEQQAKKAALQQQMLLQALFKGTENVKKVASEAAAASYDPKESKQEQKIDLYIDQREQTGKGVWTGSVGEGEGETQIVCKFFLEAVEKKQYGWFWVCPNGGDNCKYRHCLPQGYVLKGEEEAPAGDEEEETIEERVERERRALPPGGTRVTPETFAAWKAKRVEKKKAATEEKKKAVAAAAAKHHLSGRDLFSFNPDIFVDCEGAADEEDYQHEEEEEEEESEESQQSPASDAAAAATNGVSSNSSKNENEEDGDKREAEDFSKSSIDQKGAQPIRTQLFLDDLAPEDLDDLDD
ncbi:hypothetical protein, conserved [Eimeria maxima]|uniref:C3H1-type domain-containing protein n=1 Tax=Eimeria maxima TaxID=5804 RepID=U6LZI5_EIMMA|nr:hypothetical protein, conserved [Eimeria maxima]CDJ57382.1 hypothetical protein, conserved [Eimeria maxima]